ncbi:DnaJ domain-containing protein [Hyaloraphidium curvatum]|nr:DnaJ domain-containing protein [Hyaloraphidium curvatum]
MLTARGNRMLESWGFEYIPHADGPGGTWTYYAGSAGREGGESGGAGSRFFESWLGDGKYRRVLGVSSSATRTEVRKAYRELVLKYHPDKNPGCTDCHTRISEINQAYEILTERLEHRERRSKPPP